MIKTVIVNGVNWEEEIKVDTELHDDIYVEACTQAVERKRNAKKLELAIVIYAKLKTNKKNSKSYTLNSYKILLNASLFKEAELMRKAGIEECSVDFLNEKIKSS